MMKRHRLSLIFKLLACVAMMTVTVLEIGGCSGTGRVRIPVPLKGVDEPIEFEFEWDLNQPAPAPGVKCGEVTIDGTTYDVYCDEHGRPIYVTPKGKPKKIIPIKIVSSVPHAVNFENATTFSYSGDDFVTMNSPLHPAFDLVTGTAEELLDAWGLSNLAVGADGDVPFDFSYDDDNNVLDLRLYLSSVYALPVRFDFDLQYETVIVFSDFEGDAAIFYRLVGNPRTIRAYLLAMNAKEGWIDSTFGQVDVNIGVTSEDPIRADAVLSQE